MVQEKNVSEYNDFYAADFVYYLHTVFGNLDNNFLLNTQKDNKFLLKPDKVRETYKYDVLHMVTWQPKSGKENSRKYDDHITSGIKGATNSLDG
jgi:hypothetical protein